MKHLILYIKGMLFDWQQYRTGDQAYKEQVHQWRGYIRYLHHWARDHASPWFLECCPVCFDEWVDTERLMNEPEQEA